MNRLTKIMQWTHKVLGTLLSIFFLAWFLSGLVMIYHTFPRVRPADLRDKMDLLSEQSLPSIASIEQRLGADEPLRNLSLNSYLGQTRFQLRSNSKNQLIPTDTAAQLPTVDWPYIQSVVARWNNTTVAQVDTLYSLDQWIPFGRLKKEFPIYKFHFADGEKHQLYISSKSGEVLQYTSKESRFWAWIGAIPHWIYFTALRQDSKKWSDLVIWLSGIGCIMCLAGFYMGIRALVLARRRHTISPYKKFWYKWHYLSGLVFGLPALTFCFSGMMSLSSVQEWGIKPKLDFSPTQELQKMALSPADYPLDYREAIKAYPKQIRQMEWGSFGDIPFYKIYTDEGEKVIDARDQQNVRPLNLTSDEVVARLSRLHKEHPIHIEQLNAYDTYYISRKRRLELPVWKVTIDDVDHSSYYINPRTGQCRYVNTPSRWDHWTYSAFHNLSFRVLTNRPLLWSVVMWGVLLGGTFVSLSGVWLAIQYVCRLCKKKKS